MGKGGVHRVTANSRAGRSMIKVGKEYDPSAISPEVRAHNAAIEAKRKAKLEARKAKSA